MLFNTTLRPAYLSLLLFGTFIGCSDMVDDPLVDPNLDDGNVRIEAGMESQSVPFGKAVIADAASDEGGTVDSLRITGLTFMVAEITLHRSGGGEDKVKTGPALLAIDENGVRVAVAGMVPAGSYDKINVTFHRLNDHEIVPFLNDADFDDFTTDDRYTIMIDGVAYENGVASPFSYGSKVEEDLTFDLADFDVSTTDVTEIVVRLDPQEIFKENGSREVMDPRDRENRNGIDDAIRASLNSIRK